MRLGLTEILLLLLIGALALGPGISSWMSRWSRQAKTTRAEEARRRAAIEAERRARRDFILRRFQIAAAVVVALTAFWLVYTLGLRPIEAEPASYTLPAAAAQTAGQTAAADGVLSIEGYLPPDCIQAQDGWLYLAARPVEASGSVLLRVREDGSSLMPILTVEGQITAFAFGPDGDIWYTLLTEGGGALCRASHDDWGASAGQVVTQIDGRPLMAVAAVAVGGDGRVYFTEAAQLSAAPGELEDALLSELVGHTATGSVYVYDPAARSVRRVLGGVAGATGLALSPDGATLYAADMGSRCIWAVDAGAEELTAGGQGCTLFAGALPGYPTALAADAEGAVYPACRWAAADWLDSRAADPGLRVVAARLPRAALRALFTPCASAAQRYAPDGRLTADYAGDAAGHAAAVCGNRLYLPDTEGGLLRFRF